MQLIFDVRVMSLIEVLYLVSLPRSHTLTCLKILIRFVSYSFMQGKNESSATTANVVMINLSFDSGTKIFISSEIINKIFSQFKE